MKKSKFLLSTLILLLCFGSTCKDRSQDRIQIIGKIKKIADLSLLEVKFKKFLIFKQDQRFCFVPLKESRQIMCVYPRIELGIDLDQLQNEDIKVDMDSMHISVKLPAITVKKFEYDEKDYGDVLEKLSADNWTNRIKIGTIEEMHRYAENEVRKSINMIEWRQLCEERISNNLRTFLANLGVTADIEFKPSQEKYLMEFDPNFELPNK